ncbi:Protein of unknown function (DUF1608) [Candidatus Methanoperedens nitroreducens]|uniref:S-layer family duplication domain-containing protein n=1 Tax=Candidatus Methanoperedens nitratireducens TaxID=1392998 RepID=A0A062V8N4_9EURY|nr:S-layer protein domain-containing protein [Candidatus Methanoperedens nitroreducens]KCZ72898.1 Protein of unknown function (DUF1608) [Candidatus Methanoperedens nitroreducens]MDJ1423174.1 S-layer protein domain-containing protein [Candidatus Methanoperedens sp.]
MVKKAAIYVLIGIFALSLFSDVVSASWSAEAGELSYQVNHSDRIIIGTVKEVRPGYDYTDVVIDVDEWLKGSLPDNEITIRTEQGTNVFTAGAANFSVGERALLMLSDENIEKGRFRMLNMQLGKHPVSDRDEVIIVIDKLLSPVATTPKIKTQIWSSEEKMLVVGGTWEKDGWSLSVKAVDKSAAPGFILISLSYQGKQLEDARIETGKSYTYRGKNPDGSEVPLLTIKEGRIFVGASEDAILLEINWSIPESEVQILEVPEEPDQMETETPVAPAPTAQARREAPGFEMISGILGALAVWWRLSTGRNEK